MTKIFDIQKSITAANGNASLAKDLFTMLLNDLDLRFQQIENSFKSNDMISLDEHNHKLYGATAYCIAPKLRNCAAALEQALRSNNYEELDSLVANILQEIKQLIIDGPDYLEHEWLDIKL